jgi:hypothetical protein
VRRIHGDAHLQGLPGGRALLVLAASTGERVGIERSPAQLQRLYDQIGALLQANQPEEAAQVEDASADPSPPPTQAKRGRKALAAEPAAT